MELLPIGVVSARSGMAPSALRYYEEQGLLPAATRTAGGARRYPRTVLRRLAWGGIDAAHFDFITSGENMSTAKPSLAYYQQVLDRIGATPQQCAMIGNDPGNDLPAHRLGIAVYLIQPRPRPSPRHVGHDRVTTGPWSALPAWLGV